MPRLRSGYLLRNPILLFIIKIIDAAGGLLFMFVPSSPPPASPKKILIAKIDHLGDVVLFLSVLPALKKAFKDSRIDVVCGSWSRELLESHPMIGTLYTYDHFMLSRSGSLPARLMKNISDLFSLVSRLRSEKYELGLDLRAYFPNFVPVMALGGVEHKLGFSTGGFGRISAGRDCCRTSKITRTRCGATALPLGPSIFSSLTPSASARLSARFST